jgi:hypothetical protein
VARGEKAEQLLAAFDKAAAQPTAATADLRTLAGEGNAAYRAAALIEQSNMKAKAGDLKAAAALLAQVAGDANLDQSMRDMALVRQTALEFDTMKPEAVIARMKPLVDATDPVSSWFGSAAELTAAAYYHLGQYDKAGALYARIAKAPATFKSLQSRTVQMAGMLGVDAVEDRAAESAAKDKTKDQQGGAAPGAAAAAKSEEAK